MFLNVSKSVMTLESLIFFPSTLDSGINIGIILSIFEKKLKNDFNVLFDVKMN